MKKKFLLCSIIGIVLVIFGSLMTVAYAGNDSKSLEKPTKVIEEFQEEKIVTYSIEPSIPEEIETTESKDQTVEIVEEVAPLSSTTDTETESVSEPISYSSTSPLEYKASQFKTRGVFTLGRI